MNSKKYAIIKSGGKQYRVSPDDVIEVELLDAELGSQIHFDEILFINDGENSTIGGPGVTGYTVVGELLGEATGPKISSMKYKPSHHQYRRFGHRQHYSRVKITEIGKSEGKAKAQRGKHGT